MDLHAHLSDYEIIGLLGGRWDADKLRIDVLEAFPCARASGSHSTQSVELDPEAEIGAREAMAQNGLAPVGW